MNVVKVLEARQISFGCPSSWVGQTEDGREIYARYRWGYLRVMLGEEMIYHEFHGSEPEEADDNIFNNIEELKESEELFKTLCKGVGQKFSYDGIMSYDELKQHTAEVIEWP